MKIPSLSRKIWLVISTVTITGAFFAYYFLVYMESRQAELESKKFRTLSQYAKNIKNSYYELTKKDKQKYDTLNPELEKAYKDARQKVIESTSRQSEFSELLFEIDNIIEAETFENNIDTAIVNTILKTNDARIVRQVEFRVNNKDYVIFIHAFELDNKYWRIFGFCDKAEFLSQIRSVDLIYAITAILILILILLMMPLLKLWVMNELEKLQTVNVWFCGFSLVVGSSFLLLILLMANDFFVSYDSYERTKMKEQLYLAKNKKARIESLSIEIEKKFTEELRLIYDQIQESKDVYYEKKKHETDTALFPNVLSDSYFSFSCYPFFNEMLWIKKGGFQDLILATHSISKTDVVDLSSRKYFSHALHDSTWIMPDTSVKTERFALQSIHSYISNNHEAGFGTKLENDKDSAKVLAIATKLNSVMDPLLPPGYQFVFIDKNGKVWFHSTTDKNLQENFLDETGRDKKLIAAVKGRAMVDLDLYYDHSRHHSMIRPIRNTDLYLIVMHDNEFFSTPIVLTIGFASVLVFILFFIQGVHQLILLLTTFRFSLLKINRFFLSWLRPQRERMTLYYQGVWVQLFLLIPLSILATRVHSICLIICFFTLPLYLTLYHYFSLERARIKQEKNEQQRILWLHPFLVVSGLWILLINFSGYYYFSFEKFGTVACAQILVILFLIAAYFWRPGKIWISRKFRVQNNRWLILMTRFWQYGKHRFGLRKSAKDSHAWRINVKQPRSDHWYYAYLFLWMILSSLLPTYYFYKIGYYEEGNVWIRNIQLMSAQHREQRDSYLQNELKENFGPLVSKMKAMGNYLDVNGEILSLIATNNMLQVDSTVRIDKRDLSQWEKVKDQPIHNLMFKAAPALSGLAEVSRSSIYPRAGDHQWSWYETGLSKLLEYKTKEGELQYYYSTLLPYRVFKGDYALVLVVIVMLSAFILYRTLSFCITHIFGLGLLSTDVYKTPRLLEGSRCFLVGLPHSGKSKLITKMKKESGIDELRVLNVDLNKGSVPYIPNDCSLVIATDFHLDLNNHESNQQKLRKMEAFKSNTKVPVIIVSNLEPATVLDFYDKLSSYYHKEKGDYELDGNFRKCKQAFRKWKNILSGYSIHYHALKRENYLNDKFIQYELNHGDYLPQLEQQLRSPITTVREREEMILQVEELSHLYYMSIWNCLSCQEKFLLFDLAKDRFVNMRNMKTIRTLRQKGLLIKRNSLHMMNKSFNNFILSSVQEDDEMKMEEEMRKKGSWNTLHLILVIAIISILAFLGIAQQEMFKNFQGIIAATGALLPLLARFGGIFTGTKVKE